MGLELVFVDAADYYGGAEIVGDGDNFLEFFFAIFEIDGVDDGFALAVGEGLRDGAGIGSDQSRRPATRIRFSTRQGMKGVEVDRIEAL